MPPTRKPRPKPADIAAKMAEGRQNALREISYRVLDLESAERFRKEAAEKRKERTAVIGLMSTAVFLVLFGFWICKVVS